jgi:hypothetical protein
MCPESYHKVRVKSNKNGRIEGGRMEDWEAGGLAKEQPNPPTIQPS